MQLDLIILEDNEKDLFIISDKPHKMVPSDSTGEGFFTRVFHKVQHAYAALEQRFDYQENVCATLRHATELLILHSPNLDSDEAGERFVRFLDRCRRKHARWFWVDLVLALLGSLLTPIPGPNVFFLYPAARSLGHYFALSGTRKARQLEVVSYKVEPRLTRIRENLEQLDDVGQEIGELQELYGFSKLRALLERL
jgi:hypothetical protein